MSDTPGVDEPLELIIQGPRGPAGSYDSGEVVVKQALNKITCYMKLGPPGSDTWFEYGLVRVDNPTVNAANWSWDTGRVAVRTHDTEFTAGPDLVRGENSLAIYQTGKIDFMGGQVHGDQIDGGPDDFARLLIDGAEAAIDGTSVARAQHAELQTRTRLIEVSATGAAPFTNNVVADITTRHEFDGKTGALTLHHDLTWRAAITMNYAYLAMLGAYRREANSPTGALITKTEARAPMWTARDVENPSFTAITDKTDHIKMWGPSGVGYDMRVTRGWDKASRFCYVIPSAHGPKVYFSPILNYTTTVNETWQFSCQYRVYTTG